MTTETTPAEREAYRFWREADYTHDQAVELACSTEPVWTIGIDMENGAEDFWNAVETDPIAPAILKQLHQPTHITPTDARAVVAWSCTQPDWDTGPEYARHPFILWAYDTDA